ncbi:MAG: nitroreductase family protein [Candidatus Norongarragalinales archaeon]
MELFECIELRRSVRNFENKKIPESAIQKILSAAVQAPSARHVLPWKFVVIESKAKLREISAFVVKRYGLLGRALDLAWLRGKTVFHDAPLVVLIVCKENVKWAREDSALAAENAFLAARALGIGSCFIGMAHVLNDDENALRAAGVPAGHKIFAALAFGFPKGGKWPEGERRAVKIVKRFK